MQHVSDRSKLQLTTTQRPLRQPPIWTNVQSRLARKPRWIRDSLQVVPSWLTSMVVHLTVFIFLASFILPPGKYDRLDTLLVSFANQTTGAIKSPPVVVELVPDESKQGGNDQRVAHDDLAPIEQRSAASAAETPQQSHDVQQRSHNSDDLWVLPEPLAQTVRVESATPAQTMTFQPVGRRIAELNPSHVAIFDQYDDVVAQFIQYDIGSLSGKAGRRAVQRFERLGSDAIPALVRGLNQSARIHASCPVGVISRKLRDTIRSTSDPSLIQYAVENIGKSVPLNAPHKGRIGSFRNWLDKHVGQTESEIRRLNREFDLVVTPQIVKQSRDLSMTSSARLIAAIAHPRRDTQQAALLATIIRTKRGDLPNKHKVALAVARVYGRDIDPETRQIAHHCLVLLAGQDLGFASSALKWREHFEYLWRVDESLSENVPQLLVSLKSSNSLYRLAAIDALARKDRRLTNSQRHEIAECLLQELDSRPTSKAIIERALSRLAKRKDIGGGSIDQWRHYWRGFEQKHIIGPRSQAQLQLAKNLEDVGNWTRAAERYNRVIKSFPETKAAAEAQRRLQRIQFR